MKRLNLTTNNLGLSLTEVLMSTLIFTFIMAGLIGTYLVANTSWHTYDLAVRAQSEVRKAMSVLTRDFRVSGLFTFIQNESDHVVFNFSHPADGLVTYNWTSDDGNSDVNRLLRTAGATTRIIANDITQFAVTDSRPTVDEITVDIKATAKNNDFDQKNDFQISKKVATR